MIFLCDKDMSAHLLSSKKHWFVSINVRLVKSVKKLLRVLIILVLISVVFPQDLLEKGLAANNFAMLGLGDIVLPGIFIALLLRFDNQYDFYKQNMIYDQCISKFIT